MKIEHTPSYKTRGQNVIELAILIFCFGCIFAMIGMFFGVILSIIFGKQTLILLGALFALLLIGIKLEIVLTREL